MFFLDSYILPQIRGFFCCRLRESVLTPPFSDQRHYFLIHGKFLRPWARKTFPRHLSGGVYAESAAKRHGIVLRRIPLGNRVSQDQVSVPVHVIEHLPEGPGK